MLDGVVWQRANICIYLSTFQSIFLSTSTSTSVSVSIAVFYIYNYLCHELMQRAMLREFQRAALANLQVCEALDRDLPWFPCLLLGSVLQQTSPAE